MIFKSVGVLTVTIVSSLFGIRAALLLKSRASELNEICRSISILNEQITYSGKELGAILKSAFSNCTFVTVTGVNIAVKNSSLKAGDIELLNEYVKELGLREKSGENERNLHYLNGFTERKEQAELEAKQKCKILTVTGICVGLTAAVLII